MIRDKLYHIYKIYYIDSNPNSRMRLTACSVPKQGKRKITRDIFCSIAEFHSMLTNSMAEQKEIACSQSA